MRPRDAIGRLAERFDARTRRERVLLGLTVLAVLLLLWEFALRAPLAQRWSRAVDQRVQVASETERLENSVERLEQELAAVEGEEAASRSSVPASASPRSTARSTSARAR